LINVDFNYVLFLTLEPKTLAPLPCKFLLRVPDLKPINEVILDPMAKLLKSLPDLFENFLFILLSL